MNNKTWYFDTNRKPTGQRKEEGVYLTVAPECS